MEEPDGDHENQLEYGSIPSPGAHNGEATEHRVLPLVEDPGNRQALCDWLDDRYTVVRDAETLRSGDVDLCLIDPAGFNKYRDELIDTKDEQAPRILPYLLVRREDGPLLDPELRQYVDDVIVTPIGKRELGWRIGSLLRLRTLSTELGRKRDELKRKNEQLEYLMSAAAHDLRNPLNIAQGYANQVGDGEAVTRIRKALDRMEHLVDDLLAVHQTEQSVEEDQLNPVQFTTLVQDCWELTPTEDAELEVVAPEEAQVRAMPNLLRQLIENLVRNAMDHGGDTVTIRIGMLSDGFYLADDGPGIPEEKRKEVFEEGYSTSAGYGLGLSIVRRVVDAHGWDIHVTDSDRGGARFEVTGVDTG